MSNDPVADTFTEYAEKAQAEREANPLFMYSAQCPRNFVLYRKEDISGVSGTGTVAWGTVFPDGVTVIRWCVDGKPKSTVTYDSLGGVEEIHSHGGATQIIWYN